MIEGNFGSIFESVNKQINIYRFLAELPEAIRLEIRLAVFPIYINELETIELWKIAGLVANQDKEAIECLSEFNFNLNWIN